MNDEQVEKEIKQKGLTAPRVTKEQIDALVDSLIFKTHLVEGTTTTVAVAILPSGFTAAVAESACASPENFDADLGVKIAISRATDRARNKLWELEGYRLAAELNNV